MTGLGERIKEARKTAGLTQADLAEKLNVHVRTVSKWERGICEPDISVFGSLAAALGVSLGSLFGSEEYGGCVKADEKSVFDAAAFGGSVAAERKRSGRSQSELAASLNVSADTVSKWERGVTAPSADDLLSLARVFSVSVSDLYRGVLPGAPSRERAVLHAHGTRPRNW